MYVKIKKIEGGVLPAYKRIGDACMDCYSRVDEVVFTGCGMSKNEIDVCIGTIDSNYRGEVMACIVNKSNIDYVIERGDRVCQLAVREAPEIKWDVVEELSESNRGTNGFGSSGKK